MLLLSRSLDDDDDDDKMYNPNNAMKHANHVRGCPFVPFNTTPRIGVRTTDNCVKKATRALDVVTNPILINDCIPKFNTANSNVYNQNVFLDDGDDDDDDDGDDDDDDDDDVIINFDGAKAFPSSSSSSLLPPDVLIIE